MQRIDGKVCCGIYYALPGWYEPKPLPLLNLSTEITLYPTYSRTILKQHFKNPSQTEAIPEANYVFPLHNTQTITSFTCHVGEDKVLNGIVQSKPKAKATYDAAISRGETAGLLSWSASDCWQTKLGNIPAGASVEVVLTCVAQLQHDSEKDAIRFNLPTYIASRYGVPPAEVGNPGVIYSYKPGRRGPGSWLILRGANNWVDIDGGMNIKVFVDMDAPIKMVEAPAHATNLRMGTHSTSDSSNEDFEPNKAVLTLSSDTTALDKDFVVLVKTARSGHPSAVIQRHPDQDVASLMLTLVPKFNLPVAKPEVVFIVDRSGSMSGNETQLRKALAVFLQSLPVGCKFNICSFGSSHSFLWDKSKTYTEETLKQAQAHVARFEADMGGTEMFPPVKAAIERRYKDINLELLLLTDGDIWQRDQLMDYVREQCKAKTVRMFTLGIGNGISHALIDGLASVGGGYSQVVQLQEKLDSKVVRMLRAALGQHVSDYTLEFPETESPEDDDYDMVGDVGTSEKQKTVISGKKEEEPKKAPKKISLFDTSAELDPPPEYESKDIDEARWSHLPELPKLPAKIQSPHVIPPLFAFSRTNAYVVFTPAPRTLPKTARLHAKTIAGDDLELEIPILAVETGKDVSQLAARSFLQELEDGKGYLHEGVLAAEGLSKEKHESKWDDIIEREGVRWGEGFGVASKWTSFVAIEDKAGKQTGEKVSNEKGILVEEESEGGSMSRERSASRGYSGTNIDVLQSKTMDLSASAGEFRRSAVRSRAMPNPISSLARSVKSSVSGIFASSSAQRPSGSAYAPPPPPPIPAPGSGPQLYGSAAPMASMSAGPMPPSASRDTSSLLDIDARYEASLAQPVQVQEISFASDHEEDLLDYSDDEVGGFHGNDDGYLENEIAPFQTKSEMGLDICRERVTDARLNNLGGAMQMQQQSAIAPSPSPMFAKKKSRKSSGGSYDGAPMAEMMKESAAPKPVPVNASTPEERIHSLIMLQSFAGSFDLANNLVTIIGKSFKTSGDVLQKLTDLAAKLGVSKAIVATWAAILVFENGEGHSAERDTWELVVEKAVMWLDGEGKNDDSIKGEVSTIIGA